MRIQEFTALPCTHYAECELETLRRWKHTKVSAAVAGPTALEFGARDTAGLVLAAGPGSGVLRWSSGGRRLESSPGANETRPTLLEGDEPAVSFVDTSCPLRDVAAVYPGDGIAGAVCFGTQAHPPSAAAGVQSATLDVEWGGSDAGRVQADTTGLLRVTVAGTTVDLPTDIIAGQVARYTLAWHVSGGTLRVILHEGPTGYRNVLRATGSYDVATAAAVPPGGMAISGRWVHVYALSWWWQPAPDLDAWEAAVAALDAEWPWRGTVYSLVFDAREDGRMTFLEPPHSTVLKEWRAEPPDTSTWRLQSNNQTGGLVDDTPRLTDVPRPGVLYVSNGIWMNLEVQPFIRGHDVAAFVVYSSNFLSDRLPSGDTFTTMLIDIDWLEEGSQDYSAIFLNVFSNQPVSVEHTTDGVDVVGLYDHPCAPDGDGGQLYAVGWMIKDTTVYTWYVSGLPGARSTERGSGTFVRSASSTTDLTCYIHPVNNVVHEVRVVSPAPSLDTWEAVLLGADAEWEAL